MTADRRGPASTYPLYAGELRRAKRLAKLAGISHCELCGYDRGLSALQRHGALVICYECANRRRGAPIFEDDHVLGRRNSPDLVRRQPANYHRLLSDADYAAEARFYEYFYEHDLLRRLRGR